MGLLGVISEDAQPTGLNSSMPGSGDAVLLVPRYADTHQAYPRDGQSLIGLHGGGDHGSCGARDPTQSGPFHIQDMHPNP